MPAETARATPVEAQVSEPVDALRGTEGRSGRVRAGAGLSKPLLYRAD